jgi:diadenosine tetraphosphate (Ap4A) HIT family hydrolase
MDRQDCPFCRLKADCILSENSCAIAVPDGFPVAVGHSLVIPKRHVASLFDLPEGERAAVWSLVTNVRRQLTAEHHPDGFTVGVNDGIAAGQTVMHAHVHIIPRRVGDVADPRGGIRWVIADRAAYWARGAE